LPSGTPSRTAIDVRSFGPIWNSIRTAISPDSLGRASLPQMWHSVHRRIDGFPRRGDEAPTLARAQGAYRSPWRPIPSGEPILTSAGLGTANRSPRARATRFVAPSRVLKQQGAEWNRHTHW
jgi:hypothetical protein